ncbi:hypothetical protein PFISCL1PPCAC_18633, partial [Pristionchus fissidentatus]
HALLLHQRILQAESAVKRLLLYGMSTKLLLTILLFIFPLNLALFVCRTTGERVRTGMLYVTDLPHHSNPQNGQYKTGLPWKRAMNISCVSGLYHADIKTGFKNLWHVTCALPPSCTNCAELMYSSFCPEGFICENSLSKVRSNGCSRVSCREGDLMIVHPNQTMTEVFTLQCGEGAWEDVRGRIYTNISSLTCASRRIATI